MAGDATKTLSNDVLWGGGRSPFSISYGKMMMWFFLVSDALTFSGLLVAYGFVRHSTTEAWPIGEEVFRALPGLTGSYPLIYVALMTAILIFSSVTMVLAVEAGHRMDKKGVIKWMMLTVIGGAFFVGSQAWEWSHFIHGGGGRCQVLGAQRCPRHARSHRTRKFPPGAGQ
jgi:cytochrome c oxidase subunit 3